MFKYVMAGVCGASVMGSAYLAGWGGDYPHDQSSASDECEFCSSPTATALLTDIATPASASQAAKLDLKNTRCIVNGDEVGKSTLTVEFEGKVYHLCCADCAAPFNKDAAKYAKEFANNPDKFGGTAAKK